MLTSSSHRHSWRRLCVAWAAALAVFVLTAIPPLSPATRADVGAAADDELNLLLRLLSQDIRIGTLEFARPIDPLWIKDVRSLQSSSNATIAETANAVEVSVKMREEALKILATVKEKNGQLAKDNPVDVGDAVSGLLPDGVSDEDLDEAVRSGRITRSEAAAYRARRAAQDDALMTLGKVALLSYANSYLADGTVRTTRKKAEQVEADALAEHLVPALRARACAKRDDLPLKIFAGFGVDQRGHSRLLTTIISTSSEPLTRFTLLMELRTTLGRRTGQGGPRRPEGARQVGRRGGSSERLPRSPRQPRQADRKAPAQIPPGHEAQGSTCYAHGE